MAEQKQKPRASYSRGLRDQAKREQGVLWTVSMEFPDKTRLEAQGVAEVYDAQFLKWALVVMARDDLRPPGGLEEIVRQLVEKRPELLPRTLNQAGT